MLRHATMTMSGLILCLSAGMIAAEDKLPATPAGTWAWTYDYGNGPIDSRITLNVKDKQATGVFYGEQGEVEISKGTVAAPKVTFEINVVHDGQPITVRFAGEAKEDTLIGTLTARVDGEDHDFPWKAKRATRAADVAGTWQLDVAADSGNNYTPRVKITADESKLSGRYLTDELGEHDLKAIELKDNVLTFRVEISRDGHTLTIDYEVKPRGDKLAGDAKYDFDGGKGTATVSGKLTPVKK